MSEARADDRAPVLTVGALARRLGVAPATLRTWDRRYGLGPTEHAAGSHRRYSPSDVRRLDLMRRLTREGVLPVEAARMALADIGPDTADQPTPANARTERAVPLDDTEAAVRGLVKAAQALDAGAIDRTLAAALQSHGAMWAWDHLIAPALIRVGERWCASGRGVDVEHLLADCVLRALCAATPSVTQPRNVRPVLLTCAPDELHSLPLHALAATLGERGIDARVLGARVPPEALTAAVRRAGASAVFVWAHTRQLAVVEQLAAVPLLRPPVVVVVGGPGWLETPGLPAQRVCRLSEALTVLQRAAVG